MRLADACERVSTDNAASVLLLALGNTLRGDDGVGWSVGLEIEKEMQAQNVQVIFSQQLLPEHSVPLSKADLAIFVDCSAITEPGVVSSIDVSPSEIMPALFTHHLDPASLLRLTIDLYKRVPMKVLAITIGGSTYDDVDRLTSLVECGMQSALDLIRVEICKFCKTSETWSTRATT